MMFDWLDLNFVFHVPATPSIYTYGHSRSLLAALPVLLPAVPRHLAGPRRTRPPHRTRRTGRAGDAARDAARAAAVPRLPLTPRRPSPRLQARLPQEEAQVPARGTVRLLTRPAAPAPAGAASLPDDPLSEHTMAQIANPEIWIALATLPALELVLGIDNIIFLSILAATLPPEQRTKARRTRRSAERLVGKACGMKENSRGTPYN